jgi:protein-disulfide isomerase
VNDVVQSRLHAEQEHGVDGTPTFFIDGVRFRGDFRWEELDRALEDAAAKAR